jgi:hypothetical protein
LHIEAPAGVVPPEARERLAAAKAELLGLVRTEDRLLNLTLDEFEQESHSLEVRVEWHDETLFFVPRITHVHSLVASGIGRGRIWTAGELRNLTTIPSISSDELRRVGRLKAAFGADIVSVKPDVEPTTRYGCGGHRFWVSVHGITVCATCHPPADPTLVAEWIEPEGSVGA